MTDQSRSFSELVGAFVATRRFSHPDRARQVLTIALGRVRSPAELIRASWVSFATVEVYLHYDGGGYGPLSTLALLERFVGWLRDEGIVPPWDHARLLYRIDEQRQAHGHGRRGHAPAWERLVDFDRCEDLGVEFAAQATALHPVDRQTAPSAVRLLGCHASWHGVSRFGAIDPDDFAAFLLEAGTGDASDAVADAALCRIAAAFYRWLGVEKRLCPERADATAARFAQHAMAFGVVRAAS